jgi:hypothetical protein
MALVTFGIISVVPLEVEWLDHRAPEFECSWSTITCSSFS